MSEKFTKVDLLQYEKTKLFEDLAETLVKEANRKIIETNNGKEEIIGWAREANLNISSVLNTGEVLLGLLFARNIIVHGKLSNDVSHCIDCGIKFLLNNQCKTGGWTTSESEVSTASGNIVSTALAVWAFSEFELLFDRDSNIISNTLEKAYDFISSCQKGEGFNYRFRHASTQPKVMATAYALLSYVNLCIYRNNVPNGELMFDGITEKINNIIDLFNDSVDSGRAKFFEQAICFIALKQIMKYDLKVKRNDKVTNLYEKIETTLRELDEDIVTVPYKDTRDTRENGTESDFCYFTPVWLLIALDYCYSTDVPYKTVLLQSIAKTFSVANKRLSIIYEGREWIWAIAQVLMGLSIHSATQRLDEFLNIGNSCDENSVFVIYGRNSEFKSNVVNILKALSLNVITYNNSNADARGTYGAVKEGISKSAVSLVLLTGDDEGRCRKPYLIPADRNNIQETRFTSQPRMNVVFEAGYSFAHHADKNVILISVNNVRLFSDIDGINRIIIQTDNKGCILKDSELKFKKELIENLENCGCDIPEDAEDIIAGIPLSARFR